MYIIPDCQKCGTEMAKELLEGVKYGDYVQIRYGTDSDQISVEGHIEKWTENFLYIKKPDGDISKIRLDDNLRALDQKRYSPPAPIEVDETKSTALHPDDKVWDMEGGRPQKHAAEFRVLRQMAALHAGQPIDFAAADEIHAVKQLVKSSDNTELRKVVGGIVDSLSTAIKNKEVNNKYHNLRAKVMILWTVCEMATDFDVFYNLLGVLAVTAKDYEYALEPLVRAHRYTLAAYAATTGNLTEFAHALSLCALHSGEYTSIDQYISEICIARKDAEVLKELLETYKHDSETCEKIAACAYFLFKSSEGKLNRDITPYNSAYEAACTLC